jgi:hypothetical protein
LAFGGLVVLGALSEIYPGIIARTSKGLTSMIISSCAGLVMKVKQLRRREAINEADIVETKRL